MRIQLAEQGVDALLKLGMPGFGVQWIDDFGDVFPNKGVDDIQLRSVPNFPIPAEDFQAHALRLIIDGFVVGSGGLDGCVDFTQ